MAIDIHYGPGAVDYGTALAVAAQNQENYRRMQAYADYLRMLRAQEVNQSYQEPRQNRMIDRKPIPTDPEPKVFSAATRGRQPTQQTSGLEAYGGTDALLYSDAVNNLSQPLVITRPNKINQPTLADPETKPPEIIKPTGKVRSILKKKY